MNLKLPLKAIPSLLALSILTQASLAQQTVELSDLRFLDERSGELTLIDPAQELPVGARGCLLAEFDFVSDLVDDSGRYFAAPMRVFWRIEFGEGGLVVVNAMPGVPGAEWNGVDNDIGVFVSSVDTRTGQSSGSLRIPIGGFAEEPEQGLFPMLPGGNVKLTVVMGWDERMTLNEEGRPDLFLATATSEFATDWPDVWIGLERPGGGPRLRDIETEFLLTLERPVERLRQFTVEAQPPGIVNVMTSTITFTPEDEIWGQFVRTHPIELGDFVLNVYEGGTLVAQSSIQSVVREEIVTEADPAFAQTRSDSDEQTSPPEPAPALWGLAQKCIPAVPRTHGTTPTAEVCGPCKKEPHADDTCKQEGGGAVHALVKAHCKFHLLKRCRFKNVERVMDRYVFVSKVRRPCESITVNTSLTPGGVGGSLLVTTYTSATCCKYEADEGSPPSTKTIRDCE